MPDLLEDLRRAAGPDRDPDERARRAGLHRLQREIDAELAGRRPRRRPSRWRLIPAGAACLAAAVGAATAVVPVSGASAEEILQRAAAVAQSGDRSEIIVAEITGEQLRGTQVTAGYGTRRIWVRHVPGEGTREFRSLQLTDATVPGLRAGDESVSFPSAPRAAKELPFTTESYDAEKDQIVVSPGMRETFGPELFRARALLEKARRGEDVSADEVTLDGRDAYKVSWTQDLPDDRDPITIELSLWIDRETYEPLQFTDHGRGTGPDGRALDQTYKATVSRFELLPDTPANRRLLEMRPHPTADRVAERPASG